MPIDNPAAVPVENVDYMSTVKGLPLWAEVKQTFFRDWIKANYLLERIDNNRVQGVSAGNDHYFRATVLMVYRDLRDKINSKDYEDESCVKDLKRLELDKHVLDPKDFKLNLAIAAHIHLRSFLEVNGITFYEDTQVDPDHALTSEMQ